jgi:hypothetical protein
LTILKYRNQADEASAVTPYQEIEYQYQGEYDSPSAKFKLQAIGKEKNPASRPHRNTVKNIFTIKTGISENEQRKKECCVASFQEDSCKYR